MNHIHPIRRGGRQPGGCTSERRSASGTNNSDNISQRTSGGGSNCSGNGSQRSNEVAQQRGRKKKSRTKLHMPSRAGKIALIPEGDK